MYENISYVELKGLPDEQKTEALKELKKLYPDNRTLATKLGTAPVAIINLVRKYLEGKPIGRVKKEEIPQIEEPKQNVINLPESIKPKRKYNKKNKDQIQEVKPETKQEPHIESTIPTYKGIKATNAVEGIIPGNELIKRLEGLSRAILDNKEYDVTITITEI